MRDNGFTEDNKLSLLIWLRLVRVYDNSNDLSNEFLKQFDLTVSQFDALVQILLHQPVTQMDIAEHLTITKGGVSHMLGRLEKEGWIERKQDWKVKYISLTEKGQALIEKVLPLQSDFQASLFDPLTDDEKKVFYSMLKKIHRHSLNENRIPRGVQ
ncbi:MULTISPECIES: MarR family winged helix-turn-helix transcriptional regulator [Paenibacillus]|jgi:MarR family 2-MHQ and catechol resistance regulon transcriptional repressor|uniref:Transcriptional regulator n=1 Tax=Paenibacillus odorifer TaxID=189426 RepID=A0A1R0XAB9_9BACL|nr:MULTISPECIES: MarR family transcriptional regulator [Paenibacillus]MDH6427866.1 MarR family 2-MHQ and catechol resistance regulon transcriptional repressor [Paenibacillus sp. PastH-4]MDH6444508.1 MarR family 2-MHQ and catechol resistance regulon transcriptional repressor [Paenibacillus sp. PastF-4]MDH6528405.1 MarR family 2-MHQ and catechol resistance regulon transcriptional repressor [Paenibacillus sp. PastH-3]OMD31731.1 transcriptional regulator [Paenibacillus odorifer]OMD68014.1 transcri